MTIGEGVASMQRVLVPGASDGDAAGYAALRMQLGLSEGPLDHPIGKVVKKKKEKKRKEIERRVCL